jgi:hypothetical protein
MLAADGCASSSGNPACCSCGVWPPAGRGNGGRHLRALTRLDMLICRCERVPGTQTYAFTPRDTYNGFLIERYVDSAPRSYPFAIVNRITCHWHQICIQNAWRNCLNAAVKHDDTL